MTLRVISFSLPFLFLFSTWPISIFLSTCTGRHRLINILCNQGSCKVVKLQAGLENSQCIFRGREIVHVEVATEKSAYQRHSKKLAIEIDYLSLKGRSRRLTREMAEKGTGLG